MSSLASIRSKTLVAVALTVPCTIQTPTPPARLRSRAAAARRKTTPARIRLQNFIELSPDRSRAIALLAARLQMPSRPSREGVTPGAAAPVPSPMNQVSGRLGCAVPPQVQRQYHPGPAVEEQVEANEQANDPEARLGPA